jgi:hypothetical protein
VDSIRSEEGEVGSCEMRKKLFEDLSNYWLMEKDFAAGKV